MKRDIPDSVVTDLLSIPPLVFRIIRRKLILTALADIGVDIRYPHFEVMVVLKEGPLHVAEIGDRLQVAKAQMTHHIDRLVALNMVDRTVDEADRRTINVSLTKKGRTFLEKQEKHIINAVRDYISCLEDEELATVSQSLRTLRDTLSKLQ